MTNTETVNTFILEVTLIDPITTILKQLKNNEFRDCDIKWLCDRLDKFTAFALETMGKSFLFIEIEGKAIANDGTVGVILNTYTKTKFLKYFNTLLEYFKSF